MTKFVNDTALGETLAGAHSMARRRSFWMGLVGAGLIVGLVGPFGTYDTMSAPARVGYWLVVVVTTFWIGYLASFAMTYWLECRGLAPRWSIAAGAIVASVPITGWLAGLHTIIFAASFWVDALRLYPYVASIGLIVAVLSETLEANQAGPVPPGSTTNDPAWLDQLPPHLGRDLILLQAQDHYVQAKTSRGAALIRTTIQQAADALGDHGMRVHRSWWIARNAVASYAYRNGAPVVVLHNGDAVPVGRTYRRSVRQALRQGVAPTPGLKSTGIDKAQS